MRDFNISLSREIDDHLERIAHKEGITKAEAIRRAFALLVVADQLRDKGDSLGIVRESEKDELQAIGRVVDIF